MSILHKRLTIISSLSSFILGILCKCVSFVCVSCGIFGLVSLSKELLSIFEILLDVLCIIAGVGAGLGIFSIVTYNVIKKYGDVIKKKFLVLSIIGTIISLYAVISCIVINF